MKKRTFVILSLCIVFLFATGMASAPKEDGRNLNIITEQESVDSNEEITPKYQGGYAEFKYVETKYSYNTRLDYHPDFREWKYADAYYFSSKNRKTFTPSFSVSWGGLVSATVSLDGPAGQETGYIRYADGSRKSRPYVEADVATDIYDMYLYDEFGDLTAIYRASREVSRVSDVQIFIEYEK